MMDVTSQPVDPETLPEPTSQGSLLLQDQCTQCHGLVSPGQHATQDWPTIVDRMDRRMQMMSSRHMGMRHRDIEPLSSEEKQALLKYLQKHSFNAATPETLAEEQGESAKTYINTCSRCHALPDPTTHTLQEWENVVERMSKNMTNLGMDPLEPEHREDIMAYLKENSG